RVTVGALLVLYSVYSLARPAVKPVKRGGATADAGIGFLNGVLGGLTGPSGTLPPIWGGLRGRPKGEHAAGVQPVWVASFAMRGLWLGISGAISTDTAWFFFFGLPALLAGTWLGLKLYGHLDEASFRKVVLLLLLVSGIALVVPAFAPLFG